MSMPRRAMKNMGLQACCLRCDEPDDAGSARCKTCIGHHESIRDKIAKAPPDDAFYQFAKELLAMTAAPHRFDNDPVHGKTLEEQQILASKLVAKPSPLTEEDIIETFQQQRSATKNNLILELGIDNYNHLIGRNTKLIDLKNNFLLPGFIDNHTHFIYGGTKLSNISLQNSYTKNEFIDSFKNTFQILIMVNGYKVVIGIMKTGVVLFLTNLG